MKLVKKTFTSSVWQSIGVLVAILIFIATLYLERDVKTLQFTTISNTSLTDIDKVIRQEIEVLYKQRPINNLTLIQIEIANVGNRAIREEDYDRPITFRFPVASRIVEAIVTRAQPTHLYRGHEEFVGKVAVLSEMLGVFPLSPQSDYAVSLPSVLINAGDSAEIRFLVINIPEENVEAPFSIDARLADVDVIVTGRTEQPLEPWYPLKNLRDISLTIGIVMFLLAIFTILRVRSQRSAPD